jgi:hypothetical protein
MAPPSPQNRTSRSETSPVKTAAPTGSGYVTTMVLFEFNLKAYPGSTLI